MQQSSLSGDAWRARSASGLLSTCSGCSEPCCWELASGAFDSSSARWLTASLLGACWQPESAWKSASSNGFSQAGVVFEAFVGSCLATSTFAAALLGSWEGFAWDCASFGSWEDFAQQAHTGEPPWIARANMALSSKSKAPVGTCTCHSSKAPRKSYWDRRVMALDVYAFLGGMLTEANVFGPKTALKQAKR